MGLPGDLLSHGTPTGLTLGRPAFTFTPTHKPIHFMGMGYGGDHREIFWEGWHLQQGLESELMGLPRDLSSGAICADFISSHPQPTHSHLMGDHT